MTVDALIAERRQAGHHRLNADDAARFNSAIHLMPPAPASVLDVGCGVGVLTDLLASLGYYATGVDTDEHLMSRMVAPHRVASIAALPFDDASFDSVIASEILEHLPVTVYEAGRAELARVARSAVVVTVPNAESLEAASTRCPGCFCVYSIHGHVRRFDRDDMPGLLAGWHLTAIEQVGPWKLRHRSVEWIVRRRLLGKWPPQPGAVCPQCQYQQPGALVAASASGRLRAAAKLLAAAPWRQRWWLSARYERKVAADSAFPL